MAPSAPRRLCPPVRVRHPPIPSASAVQRRRRQFLQVRSFWDWYAALQVHFVQTRPCAHRARARAALAPSVSTPPRPPPFVQGIKMSFLGRLFCNVMPQLLARHGRMADIKREQGPFRNPLCGHGDVGRRRETEGGNCAPNRAIKTDRVTQSPRARARKDSRRPSLSQIVSDRSASNEYVPCTTLNGRRGRRGYHYNLQLPSLPTALRPGGTIKQFMTILAVSQSARGIGVCVYVYADATDRDCEAAASVPIPPARRR